ncbi:MAG: carboxypeptidase regulatory-like domain-containing protein [Planctomycetota bacterium]
MQLKPFPVFLCVFSVLLVAGSLFLLHNEGAEDLLAERDESAPGMEEVISQGQGGTIRDETRVPVSPELKSEPETEEGGMPASFRKALGGLKGRVVEEDGTPVPGMSVEIFGMGAQDFIFDGSAFMEDASPQLEFRVGKTRTAQDGTFRLADIYPRSMCMLGIDLGGGRATSRFLDSMPCPGETKEIGDIVLAPCSVMVGRLVDAAGEPVAEARVRAVQLIPAVFLSGLQEFRLGCSFLIRWDTNHFVMEPPPAILQLYRMLPFPQTLSHADGSFRLEGVPLGVVTLLVDRPEFVTLENHSVSTSKGGETDVGEITLRRGVELLGKVLDSEGKPVAGAEVRAGAIYGFTEFVVLQPPVRTDKAGAFHLPGVQPRSTFAAARRFPGDPWTVVGPFHPEFDPPVIHLPPAYDLKLIVVDHEQMPAQEIRLKFRETGFFMEATPFNLPITPKERMTITDKGEVEVTGLLPGEYEVLITAKGCGVTRELLTLRNEALVKRIVLQPAHSAAIRVLTEKERTPVEWAKVCAATDDEAWLANPANVSSGRTDPNGLARLNHLNPEEYQVTVSHPDYAISQVTLKVPASSETVVLMRPGGSLEGKVHDEPGVCEGPFMVGVQLNSAFDDSGGGAEAETPRFTATDLEGDFRMTHLNPGEYEVYVLKRLLDQDPLGFTEVLRRGPIMATEAEVYAGQTSYVELSLDEKEIGPSAELSGQVRIDGVPAAGARINIYAKRRYETTVDASGRFSLGRVPVGNHSLRISQLPGSLGQYDFEMRYKVDVQEDVPLYETLDILTGSLSGAVVDQRTGRTVPGVRVRARMETKDAPYWIQVKIVTSLDGKFLIEGLPIGTFQVKVDKEGFGSRPVNGVKVFPGGKAGPINLLLETPVVVEGQAVIPEELNETPWLNLVIKPADTSNEGWEWMKLDKETHTFRTEELVPGRYIVRLVGNFKDSYKSIEIEVPEGGISGLVLAFEKE